MDRVTLMTDERPWCFWGSGLSDDNRRFLAMLDPDYFRFVALTQSQHLEGKDRQRAALAIRTAHGQALETLFALLSAVAQAPRFPLGWLLKYHNEDLRKVVGAIGAGTAFPNLLAEQPVTWESLSTIIHAYAPENIRSERKIVERFAGLWSRLARMFLDQGSDDEYNSLKHGLRVMSGGFSVPVGLETVPGQPCPPDQLQSLGGSTFGSSFF